MRKVLVIIAGEDELYPNRYCTEYGVPYSTKYGGTVVLF
jgi:hypothetical protein